MPDDDEAGAWRDAERSLARAQRLSADLLRATLDQLSLRLWLSR